MGWTRRGGSGTHPWDVLASILSVIINGVDGREDQGTQEAGLGEPDETSEEPGRDCRYVEYLYVEM